MRLHKYVPFVVVILGINACVSTSESSNGEQSGEVSEEITSEATTTVSDPDIEKALNEEGPSIEDSVTEVRDNATETGPEVALEEESAPMESAESIVKEDIESYKLDQADKAPVVADTLHDEALEANDMTDKQPSLDLGTNDSIAKRELPAAPASIDQAPYVAPVNDKVLYAVRKGESLSIIAKRFLGHVKDWKRLAKVNKIKNANHITAGAMLVIPVSSENQELVSAYVERHTKTVKIRRGDTLAKIAQRVIGTNKGWKYLWKANENVIRNPHRIEVGTVLTYLASEKGQGVVGKSKKSKHKKMSH